MQLASIFMSGVEAAIIANDACGSPVPWEFCCPWLFFDGKLFHSKWLQSSMNVATLDLCEGKVWSLHSLCLLLRAFFWQKIVLLPLLLLPDYRGRLGHYERGFLKIRRVSRLCYEALPSEAAAKPCQTSFPWSSTRLSFHFHFTIFIQVISFIIHYVFQTDLF